MKILFNQLKNNGFQGEDALEKCGILQCYLKEIRSVYDKTNVTKKRHYHKGVEIHIIKKGYQIYDMGDKSIKIEEGSLLMISPLSYHRLIAEASETEKYSFSFELKSNSMAEQLLKEVKGCISCKTPISVRENISFIKEEKKAHKLYHSVLICHRVLECMIQILRLLPLAVTEKTVEESGDIRLELAKRYIEDNICNAISAEELADYCHLGKKQLSRIFLCEEGCTAMEYVRQARCRHIEKLLADPSRTLSGISEEMHFCNEYYFNTFFKQYAGMTPGAYRRTVLGAY